MTGTFCPTMKRRVTSYTHIKMFIFSPTYHPGPPDYARHVRMTASCSKITPTDRGDPSTDTDIFSIWTRVKNLKTPLGCFGCFAAQIEGRQASAEEGGRRSGGDCYAGQIFATRHCLGSGFAGVSTKNNWPTDSLCAGAQERQRGK